MFRSLLHRKCILIQQLYKVRTLNFPDKTETKSCALNEVNALRIIYILVPSTSWKYIKKKSSVSVPYLYSLFANMCVGEDSFVRTLREDPWKLRHRRTIRSVSDVKATPFFVHQESNLQANS